MNTDSKLFKGIKNSVCHVLGFGKSNRPLVAFLLKHGGRVIVHDKNTGILSEDIVCKRLGLLVIDEEQRFGVKHKEKIKRLKTNMLWEILI